MTFETLTGFAIVAMLLVMSPGPNGVLILKTVPASGRRAGFANIAGFALAFYVHCTLAVFGLSVILMRSAEAFLVLKALGAAYLFWIGIKAIREALSERAQPAIPRPVPARPHSLGRAALEGFLTNVLNPKVALFYLAVFPQFVGGGASAVEIGYLLATIHAAANLLWFAVIILLVERAAFAVRSRRFAAWLKGLTGLVFIGFGLRMATLRP